MTGSLQIKQESYDNFVVHHIQTPDARTFIHIRLNNNEEFYNSLYDYFFNENNLISYIKNKKGFTFTPTPKQYIELYQHLQNYIDSENFNIDITNYNNDIISIMQEEYETVETESKIFARDDKFGKIGEYIFCNILSNYYNFNCIIPKVHYTTDNNMSIYGIDALFYSEENNLLLFGESKFCKNINNGISLINDSLKKYQEQIQEEYRLVLSGQLFKNYPSIFNEKFGDIRDISYTIEDFIEKLNINQIGIPIFIMHGEDINEVRILRRLASIKQLRFFNLETIYYFISLPIIDKNNLMQSFKRKINEKINEYRNAR